MTYSNGITRRGKTVSVSSDNSSAQGSTSSCERSKRTVLHCFAWRRDHFRLDGQKRESAARSSETRANSSQATLSDRLMPSLIICWPGERHYTFIDAEKVRSTNPGFCFLAAGWKRAGRTKKGLIILERIWRSLDPTRCKRCGRRQRKNVEFQRESFERYAPFCSYFCRDMYDEESIKRGEEFDARTYRYER
jgi:hypothetical protein